MVSARRKKPIPIAAHSARTSSKFSPEHFERIAEDLDSGRLKLEKIVVSDDVQVGLRAIIRKSGTITYHVSYAAGESRPYLKLGEHMPGSPDHMTVENARHLASVVQALAARGVDVQEGLHSRLIRELSRDGLKWKP